MGDLSEEGLQTLHKLVRRFREMLARETNLLDNLTDVFPHLWIRSDPVIRSKKRTLECTHCSGFGHTKRFCPQLHNKEKSSYDDMVESYFV
jgi:predicted RNA-binding protein with PUA domain